MRLIDADALKELLQADKRRFPKDTWYEEGVRVGLERARVGLSREADTPTVDAEPVVHAHWTDFSAQKVLNMENCEEQYKVLGYPHRTLLGLRCSRCRMVTFADSSIRYGYCPHCGAKMDEEVQG